MHILQQFGLHILTGPFLIGAIFFTLRYWIRRNGQVVDWVSPKQRHLLVLAAALVVCLIPLREPYDLFFQRQTFLKTFIDQASWFVTAAGGTWLLYRLLNMEKEQ